MLKPTYKIPRLIAVIPRPNSFKWVLLISFVLALPLSAQALSFSVDLIDLSQNVKPGDRLYFDADFKFPENRERQDLRIKYEIIQDGKIVAEDDSLKAVETQIQFNDSIFVPKMIRSGVAELSVTVSVGQVINAHASASFNVLKGRDQVNLYIFVIVGAILFIGIMISIQIYVMHAQTRALIVSQGRGGRSGFLIMLLITLSALALLLVVTSFKLFIL